MQLTGIIKTSWDRNYIVIGCDADPQRTVSIRDAYQHFLKTCVSGKENVTEELFNRISKNIGIRPTGRHGKPRFYQVVLRKRNPSPEVQDSTSTQGSISSQHDSPVEKSGVDLLVFNTRGLITAADNKCLCIRDALRNGREHLIDITETWLQDVTHEEVEINTPLSGISLKQG